MRMINQCGLVEDLVGRRHVKSRVPVKETIWFQSDADSFHRHDGEIFITGIVGEAESCEIGFSNCHLRCKRVRLLCHNTRSSFSTLSFLAAQTSTPSESLLWLVNSPPANNSSSLNFVTQMGLVAKIARLWLNDSGRLRSIWVAALWSL